MEYLLLLVGFVLLVKGADFFVEGSSSLAKIMKVPSVIIGLTIVAMGTSAPEASVSINAALTGNNDIAISNVVGSNIFHRTSRAPASSPICLHNGRAVVRLICSSRSRVKRSHC